MKRTVLYHAPVGDLKITCENGAVTELRRAAAPVVETLPDALTAQVCRQLDEYFVGTRRTFDFPCRLRGTPFQRKVWAALCRIPYGETRTYKQIAEAVGSPKACRAVGMANHANPICIAVPCHRVIGANGALTGFDASTCLAAVIATPVRRLAWQSVLPAPSGAEILPPEGNTSHTNTPYFPHSGSSTSAPRLPLYNARP